MSLRLSPSTAWTRMKTLSLEDRDSGKRPESTTPSSDASSGRRSACGAPPSGNAAMPNDVRSRVKASPSLRPQYAQTFLTSSWFDGVDDSTKSGIVFQSQSTRPVTPSPPWGRPRSANHTRSVPLDLDIDDLLSEASMPWKNCSKPPPPPTVGKEKWTPTTLEPLGGTTLRRAGDKATSSDTEESQEPQRLYSDVAGCGMPVQWTLTPDTATPRNIALATPEIIAPHRIQTDYSRLLEDAASRGDASNAENYLVNWVVDFHGGLTVNAPDARSYNRVLTAYGRTGEPEAAQRVLNLMWQDFRRGNKNAFPNTRCYTSVMHAWQHAAGQKFLAPEKCEQIVSEMYRVGVPECKPDVYAFTCVLHCWADSNRGEDAVNRAESLFHQMTSRREKGDANLIPDNVCYSNLINVYINAYFKTDGDFSMVEKAEKTFWEMVDSFLGGNDKAFPTTRNWNTLLSAFSKADSPKAAVQASRMIERWEELARGGKLRSLPDGYSYSLLLKCWAHSPRDDAVQMLETTVSRLQNLAQSGNSSAEIDAIKNHHIIVGYTKNGCAEKAHDQLMELVSLYQESRRQIMRPDAKSFQSVLTAWSRHPNAKQAADLAESLMSRLWSLSKFDKRIEPNVFMYNSLLFCFKNAGQPRRAQTLLGDMKARYKKFRTIPPNQTSYHAVLEAWENSKDKAKHTRIRRLTDEYRDLFGQWPPQFRR